MSSSRPRPRFADSDRASEDTAARTGNALGLAMSDHPGRAQEEEEPYIVRVSNLDPATTTEDFEVFLRQEETLTLKHISGVSQLPSQNLGDGLTFEICLRDRVESQALIAFFNDEICVADGRVLHAELLPRQERKITPKSTYRTSPSKLPRHVDTSGYHERAEFGSISSSAGPALNASGFSVVERSRRPSLDTSPTSGGSSMAQHSSHMHPERRAMILAHDTEASSEGYSRPSQTSQKLNATTSRQPNSFNRDANSKSSTTAQSDKPVRAQQTVKKKDKTVKFAKPAKTNPNLGVKPAFLELRSEKKALPIMPPSECPVETPHTMSASSPVATTSPSSIDMEATSLANLMHSTYLSDSGSGSPLPAAIGPEGHAHHLSKQLYYTSASHSDTMTTEAASTSQRQYPLETIQTEGVARDKLAGITSSLTTYASPLAIWRNETYFQPPTIPMLPDGGLTVSLQTPTGPIFIPYQTFAAAPVPPAPTFPPMHTHFHPPIPCPAPFPAYFPPQFLDVLSSAGFHTVQDVISSTGDVDSAFRLSQRLAVKRPDAISDFATEFSLAMRICKLLRVAPYHIAFSQAQTRRPGASRLIPIAARFDAAHTSLLVWAGVTYTGQLTELLDVPGAVPLFVERLAERRPDLLPSFRATFHLENRLIAELGYTGM